MTRGFAWAWGILVGGHVLAISLVVAMIGAGNAGSEYAGVMAVLLVGLGPWLATIGLAIWFGAHGQPRTALGVVLGLVSAIAVAFLLVAACFGLLPAGNWH